MLFETMLVFAMSAEPTYTKDVRPIFENRCFSCHNGRIPSLLDLSKYEAAYEKRSAIKSRVETKSMPPGGGGMTQDERDIIIKWVNQGAAE